MPTEPLLMASKVEHEKLEEYLHTVERTLELDPTMNWWATDESPVTLELEKGKQLTLPRKRIFMFLDEAFAAEIKPENKKEEKLFKFLDDRAKESLDI